MQKELVAEAQQPKTQAEVIIVFEPVAQNTVIRPMAQAVCMTHGGKDTSYTDTADHKEKTITLSDLYFLTLTTMVKGHNQLLDGHQVALAARKTPIRIRVDVNDVQIFVSRNTTLTQAMADFQQKISHQAPCSLNRETSSRQYE